MESDDCYFSGGEEEDEVLFSDDGNDAEDYDFIDHDSDNSEGDRSNRYQVVSATSVLFPFVLDLKFAWLLLGTKFRINLQNVRFNNSV